MRAQQMIKHSNGGNVLLRDIQEEFTRRYPYLKIETPVIQVAGIRRAADSAVFPEKTAGDEERVGDWLDHQLGLSDTMTVEDLEKAIASSFGVGVQVFRRSGKFWIETRMTRNWTLKQQNDHGRDLTTGLR